MLTVGAFLLTVELLRLQSLKALIRHKAKIVSEKAPIVSKKTQILRGRAPTVSTKAKKKVSRKFLTVSKTVLTLRNCPKLRVVLVQFGSAVWFCQHGSNGSGLQFGRFGRFLWGKVFSVSIHC